MKQKDSLTLNQLIKKLIIIRDKSPENGSKMVYYNEDKMNGDLDRISINSAILSLDGNIDLYSCYECIDFKKDIT